MAKHGKLYEDSPKLSRGEDGEVSVKKSSDTPPQGAGEDGSSEEMDKDEAERGAMHKRHEEEQHSMHERHRKDLKEMHKRHAGNKEKTGSDLIKKTEDKKED